MKKNMCYLKSNIKAEPLIWNWYAWSHLIPPLTSGCNVVERHIKIMESYIQTPQLHAEAVLNPQLLGGPFIDLNGERVHEIEQLLYRTQVECAQLIELATSFKQFDTLLSKEMDGASLEDYYKNVPNNLRGMIELAYDLSNRPTIRLIEPLIYKNYYNDKVQSVALSFSNEDSRPFVLSTPRLESETEIQIMIPFSDNRWDILFSMRHRPQDYNYILDILKIPSNKKDLFFSFFTTTPPATKSDRKYQGDGVRVRYFGHACVLLETDKLSILIDPVLSYEASGVDNRYTYSDLPDKIDYVLITHNHQDHILFETLIQLRHKITNIIFPGNLCGSLSDPSLRLILKHLGFNNLITLYELDDLSISDGRIVGIPFLGEHSDINIQTKTGYYINLKGNKFLFAADSNNLESKLYEYIFNFVGPVDTVFIGMECEGAPLSWLYGPLLTNPLKRVYDVSRTLSGSNFEKAWDLIKQSGCKQAYVYAMGQEPWLNYIMTLNYSSNSPQIIESDRFIQTCRNHGIESERLYIQKEWIF